MKTNKEQVKEIYPTAFTKSISFTTSDGRKHVRWLVSLEEGNEHSFRAKSPHSAWKVALRDLQSNNSTVFSIK